MARDVKDDRAPASLVPRGIMPWVVVAALMAALQGLPDASEWMRYDRDALGAGEWWRVLTANFIHLGWAHLALNAAGLLMIGWLFAEDYSALQWGWILLCCSAAASIGLYVLTPEIAWCVGISGALHGLFAAGAIAWVRDGVGLGGWLLAGEALKLGYEQTMGAMPFSEGVVGGGVVTDAHLWGAIGGVCAAAATLWWRRGGARV